MVAVQRRRSLEVVATALAVLLLLVAGAPTASGTPPAGAGHVGGAEPVERAGPEDVGEPHVTDAGTVPLIVEAPGGDARAVAGAVPEAVVVREVYGTDLVALEVPEDSVDEVLEGLAAHDEVDFAGYDGMVSTAEVVPNDPLWSSHQDGFRYTRFPLAWTMSTGGPAATIAVLDTGLGRPGNLPSELAGRIRPGYNAINGSSTTFDDDPDGHGTLAATVAAGAGNNGALHAGACWSCRIMPIKVLNSSGNGSFSDIIAGAHWAADNGARIVSMSVSSVPQVNRNLALEQAFAQVRAKGVLLVAAAGNDSTTLMTYPAAAPAVIGVAGTRRSASGSIVLHPGSNRGQWVSVAAPFTNAAQNIHGGSASFSGTSSATPVVAGAAGLAVAASPSISVAELERRLTTLSFPLSGIQHGYLDAASVVDGVPPSVALLTYPGSLFGVEEIGVLASDGQSGLQGAPTLTIDGVSRTLTQVGPGAWTTTFDTRSIPHGTRTFRVRARDRVGNVRTVQRSIRIINAPRVSGFVDVARSAFYAVPVDFLAHTGVTTGVGGTNRYEPDSFVTRGQMAVFLWRMAGQPAGTGAPFADVPPNAFYTQATRWLRQTGITTGVGGTNLFDPDGPVTRSQMVTFLHRFAGTPGGGPAHSFTDVDRPSFAERAISWAAHHRVTTGIGGTTQFAPDDWVTRGQMATFIQRYARTRAAHGSAAVDLAI